MIRELLRQSLPSPKGRRVSLPLFDEGIAVGAGEVGSGVGTLASPSSWDCAKRPSPQGDASVPTTPNTSPAPTERRTQTGCLQKPTPEPWGGAESHIVCVLQRYHIQFKWPLCHVKNAQPGTKGVLDDRALPDGNIERFNQQAAAICHVVSYGDNNIIN